MTFEVIPEMGEGTELHGYEGYVVLKKLRGYEALTAKGTRVGTLSRDSSVDYTQ